MAILGVATVNKNLRFLCFTNGDITVSFLSENSEHISFFSSRSFIMTSPRTMCLATETSIQVHPYQGNRMHPLCALDIQVLLQNNLSV